jgi:hypothetical protein
LKLDVLTLRVGLSAMAARVKAVTGGLPKQIYIPLYSTKNVYSTNEIKSRLWNIFIL